MKTVSNRNEDRAKARQAIEEARLHKLAYLAAIVAKNIPVYIPDDPERDRTNYEENRLATLTRTSFIDTACDHCETPLIDRQPSMVLSTYPAQFWADCPGCGACYVLEVTSCRTPWTPEGP